YPEHGTDITGISFEPWHIRYVDLPHSKIIANNKLTLEEYIDTMEIGKFYECDGYIYIRQKMDDEILVPLNCREYVISPDNTGCYIITGKR
ncbi:MAG: M15 family metallopeptidase, partial [Clostridiales bacterium]|nr:M15 family metallopeptidase [Clostridiales bacterium]